jgi:ABC-type transport system substrate-binding protein
VWFVHHPQSANRAIERGLMLAALACACARRAEVPIPAPSELRVPLVRDIQSLDPVDAEEITTFNVVRQLYEGLVDYDPRTLRWVPRVAHAWRWSADGRECRFEIRRGVRFRDDPCFPAGRGREATAEDARYAIERGLQASGPAGERVDLPPITGLDAFLARRTSRLAGLTVPSPGSASNRSPASANPVPSNVSVGSPANVNVPWVCPFLRSSTRVPGAIGAEPLRRTSTLQAIGVGVTGS